MTALAKSPSMHIERDGQVWPYDFDVINVSDTYTDRFQRPLNERWLKAALADFDPALLGTITVSMRDKRGKEFSVVDGQHRVELCRRKGQAIIPACVFMELSIQQEADLFSRFQRSRRGITAFERFQADLIADNPQAKAVNGIVKSVGLELCRDSEGPGLVKCVVACEKIYEEDPALLREVLTLIQRTWPTVPYARSERMVKGVWRFAREESDVSVERFADRLGRVTPSHLYTKAQQLRDGNEDMGGTLPQWLGKAISNVYRTRRRS